MEICDKIVEKARIYTFLTLENYLIATLKGSSAMCHSGVRKRGIM